MKKLCILLNKIERIEPHNYFLLTNAAIDLNHEVYLCDIDTLALQQDQIHAELNHIQHQLELNTVLSQNTTPGNLAEFDLIWLMSFGDRNSFLDKIELLYILEKKVPIINAVNALLFLSNKYALASFPFIKTPLTYACKDVDFLWEIFQQQKKKWIVKPAAESWGRNVFLLNPYDTNARVILEMMTGNDSSQYCIMQEYIQSSEKRVLLCKDQILTAYQRIADANQHRNNLHASAKAQPCDLDASETALCQRIGAYFTDMGISFMGIDLIYPYVLEINVINPGGLKTAIDLYGINYTRPLINSIL